MRSRDLADVRKEHNTKPLIHNIINHGDPINFQEWVHEACRHQQKWLYLQTRFKKSGAPSGQNQKRPNMSQQQNTFRPCNTNAMDTTPGRVHAQGALTNNERQQLMKEGKCFICRKQGHMSRDCPQKQSHARSSTQERQEVEESINATSSTPVIAKAQTMDDLMEEVRNAPEEVKQDFIQKIFENQDF
ncbi:hypothetical protein EDB83DRAFT_2531640 [Lactarius deliciosus]|nr:hypothetical protein EDB83DRAFT_2531640 [Lactarius deliciosus]